MASLTVELSLDSDARCVDAPYELTRIFQRVTDAFADLTDPFHTSLSLRDSNGNQVGTCWIEEDD